jgi:hypothetical protein
MRERWDETDFALAALALRTCIGKRYPREGGGTMDVWRVSPSRLALELRVATPDVCVLRTRWTDGEIVELVQMIAEQRMLGLPDLKHLAEDFDA